MKLWCINQMVDEEECVLCFAHLAEGRVFECPYGSVEQRLESPYPCQDYKNIKIKEEE